MKPTTTHKKHLPLAAIDKILLEYKTQGALANLGGHMLQGEQPKIELRELHAQDVYYREVVMPYGTWILGKEHKTEHFNILLEGEVRYLGEDGPVTLRAPHTFVSHVGKQKLLFILKRCRWATVHANPHNIRETKALEMLLINPEATEAALAEAARIRAAREKPLQLT